MRRFSKREKVRWVQVEKAPITKLILGRRRHGMIGGMIGTAEEIIHWLFEQPHGEQLFEIKERKRKRTLTQNAYYWSMLNQLGRVLRIPTS